MRDSVLGQLMDEQLEIVRDVSSKLEKEDIGHMLTGSMAMNYYAQPRMTRDIDLIIDVSTKDVEKIVKLFTGDYYISPEAVRLSVTNVSMFNMIHNGTIIKVDCIVRKNDEYRVTEFQRRLRVNLGGFYVWIVSKEDLILSKMFWAKDSLSEFQLRDVRNLVATGCDRAYIESWVQWLGVSVLWEKCSNND